MNQPSYVLPHFPAAPADPPRAPWLAAHVAVGGLAAGALHQMFSTVSGMISYDRHIAAVRAGVATRVEGVDILLALGNLVSLALFLFAGVSFITWTFLAHRNCERLGVYPERSRGWTIGAWFIPFVNLVLPWRVMVDIREASTPHDADGRPVALPRVPVGWWWLAYLLMSVLGGVAALARTFFSLPAVVLEQTVANRPVILAFSMATIVVTVAAAVLGALVVRRITAAQDRSAALKAGLPALV